MIIIRGLKLKINPSPPSTQPTTIHPTPNQIKGHFHRIFDVLKVACSKDFRICKIGNFNNFINNLYLHQIEGHFTRNAFYCAVNCTKLAGVMD